MKTTIINHKYLIDNNAPLKLLIWFTMYYSFNANVKIENLLDKLIKEKEYEKTTWLINNIYPIIEFNEKGVELWDNL